MCRIEKLLHGPLPEDEERDGDLVADPREGGQVQNNYQGRRQSWLSPEANAINV